MYLVAAQMCTGFNHTEISEYTELLLKWWKINSPAFPMWAIAVRIKFAMSLAHRPQTESGPCSAFVAKARFDLHLAPGCGRTRRPASAFLLAQGDVCHPAFGEACGVWRL